ncbi:MAG TPA: ABC transporter permease, partial [Verrucomicrobiota bacterium]|nr:ABC transporter permease [Verrucomicrobiota bacterium]
MNLLAEVKEGLSISWEAIRANKMRSALTTLGIVIGVVTVTLMGTAIQGLDRAFLDNISAIGADILYVERFEWFTGSREDWLRMQKRPRITLEQAEQLEGQLTMSRAVAPVASRDRPVRYGRAESASVRIIGSTEQYQYTGGISIAKGRFFSEQEARGGRPVCVIGSEVAENLFRDEPPVGRRIRIDQQSFEIIGVLEKQGSLLGLISLDNQIIVPLPQFTAYFRNNPDVTIQVKVIAVDQIEEAKEE